MCFRFALISGFLFTSAVLADLDIRAFPRAGVLLESQNNGTFVTNGAIFKVPAVYPGPAGISNDTYNAAMAYTAIDIVGDSPCISALAVGVSFIVGPHGTVYQPWYRWELDTITNFDNILISAEDTVTIGIIAPYGSPQTALVWVYNECNGEHARQLVKSTTDICGSSAGWFIAYAPDPRYDPGYPIANFGTVTFANATALGPRNQTYGPQYLGVVVTDLANGDDGGEHTVATTTVNGADSITFKYVYGS